MSTLDIWEAEERQKRIWAYRRKKEYQRLAYALQNLLEREASLEETVGTPETDEQGGNDE